MKNLFSTSNLINIAIVICLISIVGIFGTLILAKRAKLHLVVGSQVNLPVDNWSKNPKNLILALQTTCHFCNESMPFYRNLENVAKEKNVRLIAVFPQSVELGIKHLKKEGINNIEVRQSNLDNLNIVGTPTLILADNKGEIKQYWSGKLSSEDEKKVIENLGD